MRSILSGLVVVASITACGGGGGVKLVDSQVGDTGNPPPPPGCDYGELHDATNDNLSANSAGTPEQTLLTYTSGTMVICGSIDMTHFVADSNGIGGVIDSDVYDISVAADTEVRVDITGAGAETLDDVEVLVLDTSGNVQGDGYFLTNHGVTDAFLPAGTYEFAMFAGSSSGAPASTTAIPYKIKIQTYDIFSTCAPATTIGHMEGVPVVAASTDNDVFAISYDGGPQMEGFFQLTTKTTDNVEASGITLAGTTTAGITGSLAAGGVAIEGDDYLDRDTYSFTIPASGVNEVVVRVDWPDSTDDLDYYMTPVTTTTPANGILSLTSGTQDTGVGAGGTGGGTGPNAEPEVNITAVQAGATYWVWVGGYMGSTTMPETYTISICPAAVTP